MTFMYSLGLLIGLIALVLAFLTGRRLTAVELKLARLGEELSALRGRLGTDPQVPPGPARCQIRYPTRLRRRPRRTRNRSPPRRPPGIYPGMHPGTRPGSRRKHRRKRRFRPRPRPQPDPGSRSGSARAGRYGSAALALALGGVLLVRYSIEQGVFGPEVRVALGAVPSRWR